MVVPNEYQQHVLVSLEITHPTLATPPGAGTVVDTDLSVSGAWGHGKLFAFSTKIWRC